MMTYWILQWCCHDWIYWLLSDCYYFNYYFNYWCSNWYYLITWLWWDAYLLLILY